MKDKCKCKLSGFIGGSWDSKDCSIHDTNTHKLQNKDTITISKPKAKVVLWVLVVICLIGLWIIN